MYHNQSTDDLLFFIIHFQVIKANICATIHTKINIKVVVDSSQKNDANSIHDNHITIHSIDDTIISDHTVLHEFNGSNIVFISVRILK
jgi:hypothetical protein